MLLRRFLFLSATLFVLPLLACGKDGAAGESCNDDQLCDAGLTCELNFPGTFCSKSCPAEGDTASCPSGTVCTEEFNKQLVCSLTCEDDDDCREGYVCTAVAGGQASACRVETQ
jgi:hypothetical protein